jgi:hypothetical protein
VHKTDIEVARWNRILKQRKANGEGDEGEGVTGGYDR